MSEQLPSQQKVIDTAKECAKWSRRLHITISIFYCLIGISLLFAVVAFVILFIYPRYINLGTVSMIGSLVTVGICQALVPLQKLYCNKSIAASRSALDAIHERLQELG